MDLQKITTQTTLTKMLGAVSNYRLLPYRMYIFNMKSTFKTKKKENELVLYHLINKSDGDKVHVTQ